MTLQKTPLINKLSEYDGENMLTGPEERMKWAVENVQPLLSQLGELTATQNMPLFVGVELSTDDVGSQHLVMLASDPDYNGRLKVAQGMIQSPSLHGAVDVVLDYVATFGVDALKLVGVQLVNKLQKMGEKV